MSEAEDNEVTARDADADADTPPGSYEKTFVIMGQNWVDDGVDYDHTANLEQVINQMRQVGLRNIHAPFFVAAYQNEDGESVDLVYQAQARPI